MDRTDTVIAVFADHLAAENAVASLCQAGFEIKDLSIVGKGFHTEEKVIGFYNAGDRIKFWGVRGAFWGGFWGLFFGGVFIAVPVIGNVIVLGSLAALVISAVESAAVVGGVSALGAALYGIGIPKDSIIQYEAALKADGFLVMAHGPALDIARARALLTQAQAQAIDVNPKPPEAHLSTVTAPAV